MPRRSASRACAFTQSSTVTTGKDEPCGLPVLGSTLFGPVERGSMWFLGAIKKPVSAYRSSAAKRVALALAEFWSPCFLLLRPQADDQIGARKEVTSAARRRQFSGAALGRALRCCLRSRRTRLRPIFFICDTTRCEIEHAHAGKRAAY